MPSTEMFIYYLFKAVALTKVISPGDDNKYNKYLGDGDSKGFMRVLESKPYGEDTNIEKLECIGHVQKRMGSRLRKLKKKHGWEEAIRWKRNRWGKKTH